MITNMKRIKNLTAAILALSTLASPLALLAADQKPATNIKPYPLTTCVVSGEKLGEMGDPYIFTNGTRQIKLCCKSCLKDFKKDPAKYVKKLDAAETKGKS